MRRTISASVCTLFCVLSALQTGGALAQNAAQTGPQADSQTPVPQTSAQSSSLNLKQALDAIASAHPGVLAARSRFGAASLQYEAAQYGAFPTLDIDSGRASGGSTVSTVRLTQPIYAFGRISNTTNAAEKRVDTARDTVVEQIRTLQDQAISQFYDVLRTADRLRTAKDNTLAHLKLEETINRRTAVGVANESDLELAKTRRGQAQNDEAAAQAAHRKALSNLRSLLSSNVDTLEMPKVVTSTHTANENALIEKAYLNSPVLRRLRNEAEALQYEAKALSAATKPQVVLRAERIENNFSTNFQDTRVIAALQFNPGAGLSAVSNANAGAARAEAAALDIGRAERELAETARALLSDYEQTQAQLKFLEALKASNANLVEAFLRQFQAGKRSWLDVLNAQRESTQASLSYVDSFYAAQSLASRIELLATGAEDIGGVAEVKDLPTQPRLLEALMPSLSSEKATK